MVTIYGIIISWDMHYQSFCISNAQTSDQTLNHPPLCVFSQIEREVTEAMMKSLKYCDLQTESARQPLYQYRAATIHHRLASMYHSCFRNQVGKHVKLHFYDIFFLFSEYLFVFCTNYHFFY